MDDVIKKILEGNTELYREIVSEFYEQIFYFIKKQVFNYDDSLDITQDVFVKVYKNLKKYDKTKSSFKTWIYKVASNYCYDYFKSKSYKSGLITDELNEDIPVYQNILGNLVNEDMIDQIQNIMSKKFKKKHQLVMQLYYFAELDVSEIAKTCEIPIKTIYSILNLSIKKIRLELESKYE